MTNFEIGLKGGALDNRLQLTAAVYVMQWDGRLQQTVFDWAGVDPDPVTGLCADPLCWNDGTNDPQNRVFNIDRAGQVPDPGKYTHLGSIDKS